MDGFYLLRRHALVDWLSPHVLHTILSYWGRPVDWTLCACVEVRSSLATLCMQILWRQEDRVRQLIQAQQAQGRMEQAAQTMQALRLYRTGCSKFHGMILRIQQPDVLRWTATVLALLTQWLSRTSLSHVVDAISTELRMHRASYCSRSIIRSQLGQYLEQSLHQTMCTLSQQTIDASVSRKLLMDAL